MYEPRRAAIIGPGDASLESRAKGSWGLLVRRRCSAPGDDNFAGPLGSWALGGARGEPRAGLIFEMKCYVALF